MRHLRRPGEDRHGAAKLLAQHDAVALAEDIDRVKVRYTALIGSGEWPDEALGEEL